MDRCKKRFADDERSVWRVLVYSGWIGAGYGKRNVDRIRTSVRGQWAALTRNRIIIAANEVRVLSIGKNRHIKRALCWGRRCPEIVCWGSAAGSLVRSV